MENEIKPFENEMYYERVSQELLDFRNLEREVHPLCEKLWQYDCNQDEETEEDKIERLELMDKIAHIIAREWLDPMPYRYRK